MSNCKGNCPIIIFLFSSCSNISPLTSPTALKYVFAAVSVNDGEIVQYSMCISGSLISDLWVQRIKWTSLSCLTLIVFHLVSEIFPSDLFKRMVYFEFCKTKAQNSLSFKCSAFPSTIASALSSLEIKVTADTSSTGDLLPLFLH